MPARSALDNWPVVLPASTIAWLSKHNTAGKPTVHGVTLDVEDTTMTRSVQLTSKLDIETLGQVSAEAVVAAIQRRNDRGTATTVVVVSPAAHSFLREVFGVVDTGPVQRITPENAKDMVPVAPDLGVKVSLRPVTLAGRPVVASALVADDEVGFVSLDDSPALKAAA